PAVHGAVDPTDRLDPERSPFLAQMLADAGYVTAAFTGGAYLSPDFGFAQGFDRYASNDPVWALDGVRGRQLMEMGTGPNAGQHAELLARYAAPMISEWIERQDDGVPFFLFAHTYVVHNYSPDPRRLKARGLLGEKGQQARLDDTLRERFNAGEPALREQVVAELVPYYDATIEMADEFVGGLLDTLERTGQAGRTLVIVTSDHGEEFGEHGYFGHGKNLYESNVRVPLLVRMPEGPVGGPRSGWGELAQPAVIDELVSLVDLPPFILRTVGLAPDPRMSLGEEWDALRAVPPARSRVVMELDTRFERVSALREGDFKLHVRTAPTKGVEGSAAAGGGPGPAGGAQAAAPDAQLQLFDVVQDAGETADLGGGSPQAAPLRSALERFQLLTRAIRAASGGAEQGAPVLDPATRELLIQMGYVEEGETRNAAESR
ncbi:MAG TPA: sulfatase-like hydrolase/transferase, partial [Planctomycetota bacterium]|nr:sulfatase-like hydrolase/transferase [Planctomycetota bacterium]